MAEIGLDGAALIAKREGKSFGMRCTSLIPSIVGLMGAWLSPRRPRRFGPSAQRCARVSQAATLMYALVLTSLTHIHCGNYLAAKAQLDEGVTLGNEKGGLFWEPLAMALQGCVSVLTDNASHKLSSSTLSTTKCKTLSPLTSQDG